MSESTGTRDASEEQVTNALKLLGAERQHRDELDRARRFLEMRRDFAAAKLREFDELDPKHVPKGPPTHTKEEQYYQRIRQLEQELREVRKGGDGKLKEKLLDAAPLVVAGLFFTHLVCFAKGVNTGAKLPISRGRALRALIFGESPTEE